MIVKDVFSAVRCDRCGKDSEGHEFTYFSNESDAIENAWESGWHTPDDKPRQHYCPDCFIEKEDETLEILPPWPGHVKKLRNFIEKVMKVHLRSISEIENGNFVFKMNGFQSGVRVYDKEWIVSFLGEKLVSSENTEPNKFGSFYTLITVKP